jgi:starch phosphorylase
VSCNGSRAAYDTNDVFRKENTLNLTYLALNLSHYVNGVAKRHAEVSRLMFAKYQIDAITNGVHAATWAAPIFRSFSTNTSRARGQFQLALRLERPATESLERSCGGEGRLSIPSGSARTRNLDPDVLTLGLLAARRHTSGGAAAHESPSLESHRCDSGRPANHLWGKAHPNDSGGKEIIQRIWRARDSLKPEVKPARITTTSIRPG